MATRKTKNTVMKSVSSPKTKICQVTDVKLKQRFSNSATAVGTLCSYSTVDASNVCSDVKVCSLAQRLHQSRCCKGLAKLPPISRKAKRNINCNLQMQNKPELQCAAARDTAHSLGQTVQVDPRDKWEKKSTIPNERLSDTRHNSNAFDEKFSAGKNNVKFSSPQQSGKVQPPAASKINDIKNHNPYSQTKSKLSYTVTSCSPRPSSSPSNNNAQRHIHQFQLSMNNTHETGGGNVDSVCDASSPSRHRSSRIPCIIRRPTTQATQDTNDIQNHYLETQKEKPLSNYLPRQRHPPSDDKPKTYICHRNLCVDKATETIVKKDFVNSHQHSSDRSQVFATQETNQNMESNTKLKIHPSFTILNIKENHMDALKVPPQTKIKQCQNISFNLDHGLKTSSCAQRSQWTDRKSQKVHKAQDLNLNPNKTSPSQLKKPQNEARQSLRKKGGATELAPKPTRQKWNTRRLYNWWKENRSPPAKSSILEENQIIVKIGEDTRIYEFEEKDVLFGDEVLHGAYLRPVGSREVVSHRDPSSCNVGKSTSYGTRETFSSDGTSTTNTHQPKGNFSDRSAGFQFSYSGLTTESVRSVDSQRSLTTVTTDRTTNTSRIKKSTRRNTTELDRTRCTKTKKGPIIRTSEKSSKNEIVLDSLKAVREENRNSEGIASPKKPPRAAWQLTGTKALNPYPFRITKCRYTEEEPESSYQQSEIVSGCRIISTSPDEYSYTLKTIHPSSKKYQTFQTIDPQAKEELLADFAGAGIDLEKLGDSIEDVGIKVSHDPITHRFKEILVYRPQENFSELVTTRFI